MKLFVSLSGLLAVASLASSYVLIDPITGRVKTDLSESQQSNEAGAGASVSPLPVRVEELLHGGKRLQLAKKKKKEQEQEGQEEGEEVPVVSEQPWVYTERPKATSEKTIDAIAWEYYLGDGSPLYKYYNKNPYGRK